MAMQPYTIVISSDFEELWRYNIAVMASVRSGEEEVEFLKHTSEVAPVGAELAERPKAYNPNRRVELQTKAGTALTLYIYIIPHTLPHTTDVTDAKPFELEVEVKHGKERLFHRIAEVNQWSGENIEIVLG